METSLYAHLYTRLSLRQTTRIDPLHDGQRVLRSSFQVGEVQAGRKGLAHLRILASGFDASREPGDASGRAFEDGKEKR
jgi:hypothetical protein